MISLGAHCADTGIRPIAVEMDTNGKLIYKIFERRADRVTRPTVVEVSVNRNGIYKIFERRLTPTPTMRE